MVVIGICSIVIGFCSFVISTLILDALAIMNRRIEEIKSKLELQKPSYKTVYIDATQTLQQQYDYINKFMSDPSFGSLEFKTQQKYHTKLSLLTELMALGV